MNFNFYKFNFNSISPNELILKSKYFFFRKLYSRISHTYATGLTNRISDDYSGAQSTSFTNIQITILCAFVQLALCALVSCSPNIFNWLPVE